MISDIQQRLEVYKSRPLMVGAILFVLISILVIVAYWSLKTEYKVLFTNLKSADAATIVTELEDRQIPFELSDDNATISVPAEQVDATKLAVMSENLPLKGTVGFELFNESDMGLTEFAQRINYQRALQGELARTIMTLDNVESARVHLSIGERTLFRDDRVEPKASVLLVAKNQGALARETVAGVQGLVAAAVPDLRVQNVVVLGQSGALASEIAQPIVEKTPDDRRRGAVDRYFTAKLSKALAQQFPQMTLVPRVVSDWRADVGDDAPTPGSDSWDDSMRVFPLAVNVTAMHDGDNVVGPQVKQQILDTVTDTLLLSDRLGDTVNFETGGYAPAYPRATASSPGVASGDTEPPKILSPDSQYLLWGIPVIVFSGLALGVWYRWRRQAGNSDPVRFSDRLRELMEMDAKRTGDRVVT